MFGRTQFLRTPRRWRRLLVEFLEQRTVLTAGPLAGLDGLAIDRSEFHPTRLLVGMRPGSEVRELSGVVGLAAYGARPLIGNLWELDLSGRLSVDAALDSIGRNPLVAYAEPDYTLRMATTPNDSQFATQWALHNVGQNGGTADADIDAPEAWDLTTGSTATIVAVIDTGVDYNHPDLAANIWTNPGEISGDGQDNDGNGFVDDVHGYDFINEDGNPLDDQGHGTHVAGTIGARTNNGVGVAGINWNVRIMALKFLGADGSGSTSDAIRALNYAVQMGAKVSNNSYGDAEFSQAFRNALEAARQQDHIFVAAAGNSSSNNDQAPFYPASYDAANVISVAASDRNDRLASFSSYGRTTVDLAAPGVDILSTTPNNTYTSNSGTSMASPHVAGVVGLVRGLHPTWSYQQVIDQVLGSVDYPAGLEQFTVTGGRLNAARAVGVPDTTGPRIVASDPTGATAGPLSSVRVTFDEPLDAASFTTADISFTGPGGSITVGGVSVVSGSHNRKFDITFPPQFVKGNYELLLGPAILDAAGNAMNQDGDTTNGEVPDDHYPATIVIGDVHIASAQDVPVSLSMFSTSRSYIQFPQDLSIADLNVRVDINFPDAGLLALTLVSPAGTRISLSPVRGFLGPNFTGTVFDDEALTPIASGSPPFTGSFRPNSPLSVLDGRSSLGTWTLEVSDNWFDSGAITAWSLAIIAHPPRITIADVTLDEGDSGTSEAVFTALLSNVIGDAVTVDYATANGTATAGSDYLASSGTLTFAPGELSKTIRVTVQGDTADEPGEDFFLDLTNANNATLADPRAVATIRNDEAHLSIGDVALVEGNSGVTSAVFAVSLAAASSQTISVSYATANATATSGSDYTAASGTLTFLPGETSKTIVVAVSGDNLNESDETFLVNLTNPVNAAFTTSQASGIITNDDPLPALSASNIKIAEGHAGTKTLNFGVNLSAPSGRPVSVNYSTLEGTATAGSDFTAASGTLTFTPGQTSKSVNITIQGDTQPEADETLLLALANPSGAIFLDALAVGTIQNDDTSLSIGDATFVEGDAGVAAITFAVSLSAPVSFEVRASFATANGTASAGYDFVSTSGTLVFSPGQTTQNVTVLVLNDLLNEASETILVNLTNPQGALLADNQGVATLTDNDPVPSVSLSGLALLEGNAGTKTLAFTASLSAASGRTVTAAYTTADGTATAGSDYVAKSGTLSFGPGSVSQTINVTLNGDAAAEADETLLLTLNSPANATLATSAAEGILLDDDNLTIADVSVVEGDSGALAAIVSLNLASPQDAEVRVDYATANGSAAAGSDFVAVSGTVVFPPGTTTQSIAVPILADLIDELDETVLLNFTKPVNVVLADTQAILAITDDDQPPVLRVADVVVVEGNSGTRNLTYVFTLSAPSNKNVSVQYATADGTASAGSDYLAKSGTLTFFTGATAQTLNITVNGDTAAEADETLLLTLSAPLNATLENNQALGTIASDDPWPLLSVNDVKLTEGQTGTRSLNFSIALSSASTSAVTVDYATIAGTATAGSDYTPVGGTLTFTPGQTSKLVTVPLTVDLISEPDEAFSLILSNAAGTALLDSEGLATIQNDDLTLSIGDASSGEGHSGQTLLSFPVSLSAAAGFEVRVNYATANSSAVAGSDFVAESGTLVFAPGQTTQLVTVAVFGDQRDEVDETLLVNLSAPASAQLADGQAAGTIVDDDPLPALSISGATLSEGNSGTKNLNFTVSVSAVSGRNITVQYATANGTAAAGSDYQARSGTFTLLPGWSSGTITVPLIGDTLAELDETLLVTLSSPSGATLAESQVVGTIQDDDNLSVGDITVVEGDGVTTAAFTVALAVALPYEVRLDYATSNGSASSGSDYLAVSGTVILAPGQTSQTIAVPVLGDRVDEADETILLNLLRPVGLILADTQAALTITDDDPLPRLSINDAILTEGNAGTKNLTFTVSLSELSGRNVNVQWTTADDTALAGSDYAARSGTLTFLAGWTSQTFTVTINGDSTIEPNERLLINLSNVTNAALVDAQGEGWLLNDDASGIQSLSLSAAVVGSAPGAVAVWLSTSLSPTSFGPAAIGQPDQPVIELPPMAVDHLMRALLIRKGTNRSQQPQLELRRTADSRSDRVAGRSESWDLLWNDLLPWPL